MLHRVWRNVFKLYEDEKLVIILNDKVDVIDGNGRKWKTREPAICFFYKDYWFNIICMIRSSNIHYYCNLSSPYVEDTEGLKYIDYDLDVKLFPNGEVLILDRDEFNFNIKDLHYSNDITDIIKYNLNKLLEMIKNKQDPFNEDCVNYWYKKFVDENSIEGEKENE